MKLLAISGGPDSMFMLDLFKKSKIVVAHVNYHKRIDSDNDERIVREFCEKYNIPFHVMNVTEKPKGNFQSWAREIRYSFFKEIYDQYSCKELLIAHHKDDFIETALMQQQSNRTPKLFGIKKYNVLFGMKIYRPLLNFYYKNEILEILEKKQIAFAVDSTNAEDDFTRNVVRHEVEKMSRKEKNDIYKWFKMSNKILKKKNKKVQNYYKFWKRTNYELAFFRNLKKYQHEIIFEAVHDNFDGAKLSSKKIESIQDFINGQEGNKEFKINDQASILKANHKLQFIKK